MSKITVRDVQETIQQIAPVETAESFDNVGILMGDSSQVVDVILCALDITMEVVEEAKKIGAQLIVSHHPLIFHPVKRILVGEPQADIIYALIRANISVIAAHTNADLSPLSGSMAIVKALGLQNIVQDGYVLAGDLQTPSSGRTLASQLHKVLKNPCRVFGDDEATVNRVAMACGAYGEGYQTAIKMGAQAYLTGEIRHHEAVDAVMRGVIMYEGGHYATETIMISGLCAYLQNALSAVEYSVQVVESSVLAYKGALDEGGTTWNN